MDWIIKEGLTLAVCIVLNAIFTRVVNENVSDMRTPPYIRGKTADVENKYDPDHDFTIYRGRQYRNMNADTTCAIQTTILRFIGQAKQNYDTEMNADMTSAIQNTTLRFVVADKAGR